MYKNATGFCILVLYPATFLDLLVLTVFLVESLGFSMYYIMLSANSDSFTSSFLIWMPIIYFYCLTVYYINSKLLSSVRKIPSPQPHLKNTPTAALIFFNPREIFSGLAWVTDLTLNQSLGPGGWNIIIGKLY